MKRREILKATAGLAAARSLLNHGSGKAEATTLGSNSQWSQYQADSQNTGRNPNSRVPVENHTEEWSFNEIQRTLSNPIIDEETNTGFIGSLGGTVYAFDLENGSLEWENNIGNVIESTPSVTNENIYVPKDGGPMVSLDISDGEKNQEYQNFRGGVLTPLTFENQVSFQDYSGDLHITDENLERLHEISVNDEGPVNNTIARDNETGNLGFLTDSRYRTIDPENGEVLVQVETEGQPAEGAAITNGKFIFNSSEERTTYAIEMETGDTVWEYSNGWDDTSPVIAGEKVIVANIDGEIEALDQETGQQIWSASTGSETTNDTVAGENTLAAFNTDGITFLYDLDSGELLKEGVGQRFGPEAVYQGDLIGRGSNFTYKRISGDLRSVEQNQSPTANFSVDDELVEGAEVVLDGSSSSDPDGSIESYEWDIDGVEDFSLTGPNAAVTFEEPGSYTIELTVTDDQGATDSYSESFNVEDVNQVPTGNLTVEGDRNPGSTLNFFSNASDPDGSVSAVSWDFDGDGDYEEEGVNAEHSYEEPGTYHVSALVTDEQGATTELDTEIEVTEQDLVDLYAGEDGELDRGELLTMLVDYSEDQGRDPSRDDVLTALVRYSR